MKKGLNALGHGYNLATQLNKKALQIACRLIVPDIPYKADYRPFYSPWESEDFQKDYQVIQKLTLVKPERCYGLRKFLETTFKIPGEIWECGTYRGGTARLMADHVKRHGIKKTMRLFDTFGGMPKTDSDKDLHEAGDFQDTSPEAVRKFVGNEDQVVLHQGWVPETFRGLEQAQISFAHIDLDIYQGIKAALEFISPRLSTGGIIVFDDYGFPTCPGAKMAVDEMLGEQVISLTQGQAVFIKN